jgi:hypothetical protein
MSKSRSIKMGLLNDVKGTKVEDKAPVVAKADKAEKKAKAKERKAAKQAALKKVIEYLEKNPIKELEAEVKLLKPSERAPGAGFGGPSKLVLIFGEISPKSIAKDCPEKFAMFSAPLIRGFIFILTPINFIFACWKKLLTKLFKLGKNEGISQEELLMIVDEV